MLARMWRKGNTLYTLGGNVNWTATMENSMEFPQETKNRIITRFSYSSPGYGQKKMKTLIQKDTCTPLFTAALFTIARTWKEHKYP